MLRCFKQAPVVELVDTRDLKSCAKRRAGSIPAGGTIMEKQNEEANDAEAEGEAVTTSGTYYCGCCGASQPGPHYNGCSAIGGFYPAPTPTHDQHERVAAALERIAAALEGRAKP